MNKKSPAGVEDIKEETGPKSFRIENGPDTVNNRPGLSDIGGPFKDDLIMVENQKLDNGEIYTGPIKSGKRSGNGTMVWPNSDKYVGGWENDLFEGHGTFSQQSGEIYEGQWKGGKLNGHAKVIFPNGYFLESDFIDDVSNGLGKEIEADGRIYEGEFKDGKKIGKGIFLIRQSFTNRKNDMERWKDL